MPADCVRVVAILGAAALAAARAVGQPLDTIAFSRDIAPLIGRHCTACHRDGGDAPFDLTTAGAVRDRAATIASVVVRRYMPPWKPEPGFGRFDGEARLPDAALSHIEQWVRQGAPLDVPRETRVGSGEAAAVIPPPDVLLRLPAYALTADGPDVFRNFVVRVPGAGVRYVRGLVFRPQGQAVHHANIRVDRTAASRQLDEADPEPGYEGLILRSADFPDGHFLGWTPGQIVPLLDADVAWRLDAGADLVVQLHMRPTGRVEHVAPTIGLYFTDRPAAQRPVMVRLGRQTLSIPAGSAAYTVSDEFVLPVAVEVRAVQPHAHFRARRVEAWATPPGGARIPLLTIADWDARWQGRYQYAPPVRLPAGTRLDATYVFDNSDANPRNPVRPPAVAEWGWRTSDEMGDVWLQVVAATDAERARLERAAREKMQTEDVLGCEVLLAREPGHVALRNDAALLYMALGRPAEAVRHFAEVTRLDPESAQAWFNEGVALEALGRVNEAARRYQEAIARRPAYSAALNNLGAVWLRGGRVRDAVPLLMQAVRADAANVEARANLALALALEGSADDAVTIALQLVADHPEAATRMTPLARLLAAHPDAGSRRPGPARDLAARIVAATGRSDPSSLDALAIALAATGQFDEAVRVAEEALSQAGAADADDIRGRLSLYRTRQPFVLPRP